MKRTAMLEAQNAQLRETLQREGERLAAAQKRVAVLEAELADRRRRRMPWRRMRPHGLI